MPTAASSAWRFLCCVVLLACGLAPATRAQEAAPSPAPGASTYVVEDGDTLFSIAQRHGLTVDRLRQLNGLQGNTIYPGQELRVRVPGEEEDGAGDASPPRRAVDSTSSRPPPEEDQPPPPPDEAATPQADAPPTADTAAAGAAPPPPGSSPLYGSHQVEAGATWYTLAARYGTTADTLAALNRSAGRFLEPGASVRLPPALGPPTHVVEEGETIYDIAQRYNVSARLLQHTNELERKAVRVGERLRIPGRSAPQPQPEGTRRPVRFEGAVARYPSSYEGRLMAGGAPYDPQRYVASHPSLPIGTVVLLTNTATGQQTFAEVADRGPLDEQYVMDVSAAVYEQLGLGRENGEATVTVRVMD